jgi:hypothetical protein
MFKQLLTSMLLLATMTSFSQVSYRNRIEKEISTDFINDNVHPLGKNGVMVVDRGGRSYKKLLEWKYEFYNTSLEKESEKSLLIGDKMRKWGEYKTKTHVHQLFRDNNGLIEMVSVNMVTKEFTHVKGDISGKVKLLGLTVLGDIAVCIASDKKTTQLAVINWVTGKSEFIPISIEGYKANKLDITHIQVIEESKEFFVYITAVLSKTETKSYVVRLDDHGKKQDVFKIEDGGERNIVSISASKIGDDEYIFSGTFSLTDVNQSQGVFILQRSAGKTGFKNFVKFQDLDNFMSYFPDHVESIMGNKEERVEKRGKELLVNCNVSSHEIINQGTEHIMLGEVYFPTYKKVTTTSNGTSTTRTEFDGYDYNHAFVVKFDNEGNVIWDDGFELVIYQKTRKVKKFISVAEQNESSITLVYASGSYVHSKSVAYETGEAVDTEESNKIETGIEGEETQFSQSDIEFWYDNYYLSYGYQLIKNKTAEGKKKRKVFYVVKVEF